MTITIPFNKPYLTGKEVHYIYQAVYSGKISGNGDFTKKCHDFFRSQYDFKKCLLTTSCTDALEMAAILADIQPGDEVIIPSYTFVSTANAFALRGASIVFADSRTDHPGLNEADIEKLITPKTKVIVPVHYAGVSCDMDTVMDLATKHNLIVIEDAAQAIDSFYTNKHGKKQPLGSIGHMSAFSFHETKNIIAGEGGMLVVNDERFAARSEIIWEKGTNRSAFFRGEVNKYGWVDIGSSFLPSEVTAAFLYAQLEHLRDIQNKRHSLWQLYLELFSSSGLNDVYSTPIIPTYASNNAHMFYILCPDFEHRQGLIQFLKEKGILSVFHYLSLHQSPFFKGKYNGAKLEKSDEYADTLLRLPFFNELKTKEVEFIVKSIAEFNGY
ncbi:MAG: dTDP-4-amino-4,6-dideoxygalactose transaminase [Imperialibacter sp.]|uniref:dTDP-4-amino-4,6-dideoxygalactose transaminase n=1 Tax=Imperialibacter sp. TaxID=2038411 RepID=UPI0032F007E1